MRERQTAHADECTGRAMLSHVFLEQNDASLEMLAGVCQVNHYFSDVSPGYLESRQHPIEVLERLSRLCLEVALTDERALHVVGKLARDVDGAVDAVPLAHAVSVFPWNAVAIGGGHLCHIPFPF